MGFFYTTDEDGEVVLAEGFREFEEAKQDLRETVMNNLRELCAST